MKKKMEYALLLDDLRSQDSKRRLHSVQFLKEIATALGPVRTRTQFLEYLTQFIDDQQAIVMQLLNQLSSFSEVLGGPQHQKSMIPLLMAFCKTDEKKEAEKASQIIEGILKKNKNLILQTVKKLAKTEMSTSKEAAARLISMLIGLVPQNESQLIQIYSGMVLSSFAAYKIIGAKYLSGLLQRVKNKEQIGKLIEVVYNQTEDLPKILALQALIKYYEVNPTMVLSKFKAITLMNNWRINIKICQNVPIAAKIFTKTHFKSTFQMPLIKFLDSPEPQLRAKACGILKVLASMMNEQEIRKHLIPIIKKLSVDPVDYVKIQLSENIVGLVEICSGALLNEQVMPIIFSFIKSNDLAVGVIKNLQSMTQKLNPQTVDQKILIPLANQFMTEHWKNKCKLIELLGKFVNNKIFLSQKMIQTLVYMVSDRINAVREKSNTFLVNIMNKQSAQWCDDMIIPRINNLKNSQNYHDRQALLEIISKTANKVSQKTLNQFYRPVVLASLVDKVSNVRIKALKTIQQNRRLYDRVMEKYIDRLKVDEDGEVKSLAVTMVKA